LGLALLLQTPVFAVDYKVTVNTTECNGDTGFASIDIQNFYRIETTDCAPEKPDLKLKQVLVKSSNGYDVFNVTLEDAKHLQQEIKRYMDAKRRALENGSTVILEK